MFPAMTLSSRPAAERYEMQVQPARGPLRTIANVVNWFSIPIGDGVTFASISPSEIRIVDREDGRVVRSSRDWRKADAELAAAAIQRDIDAMTAEEFRAEWNLP